MNAPLVGLSSKNTDRANEEIRADLGPARKRERLLQRVRAARKRLPQAPEQRRAA
jgi:hypothetical protein